MTGPQKEVSMANDGENGSGSEYERFFVRLEKSFAMCALVQVKL